MTAPTGRRVPPTATVLQDRIDLAEYRERVARAAARVVSERKADPSDPFWTDLQIRLSRAEDARADAYAEYARMNRESLADLTDGAA